ncbi:hypothetical protein [Candidatus Palauibacter sp.]|uniref:hypothetical protein n=1 Tax=Candidatus Palauibacter sp. TaxID=3101350 RepID=UPI003AF21F41
MTPASASARPEPTATSEPQLVEHAAVVRDRINYYNQVRRHSSLEDRPPLRIIEDFYRES